jgi:phospholipase D1/2
MTRVNTGSLPVWTRFAVALAILGLGVAAWMGLHRSGVSLEQLAAWLMPHRHAWYALPAVMLAFIVLGLAMVPVILLIAATGIAFGPLLGPVYAMAGCLASASTGFAIGRWMGPRRISHLGGARFRRITKTLTRNGTLAVFFVRKVPAPFTLMNVFVGASTIRFRDFIVGTLLGMGAFVVGLAGFGYQITSILRDPSAGKLLGAALFVIVPLTLAVLINHAFRRLRPAE